MKKIMLSKKAIVLVFANHIGEISSFDDIACSDIFKVTSQGLGDLMLKLSHEEYVEIFIQPLTIIMGREYMKIKETALIYQGQFYNLKIGKPLLVNQPDQICMIDIMKIISFDKKKEHAVVWVGHGSRKSYGETYKSLSELMGTSLEREILITLDDLFDLKDYLSKVKSWNVNEVIIRPFFLFAGNHYINEVVSDNIDSLKSKLKAAGYNIQVSYKGLLSYNGVVELFKEKILQEE